MIQRIKQRGRRLLSPRDWKTRFVFWSGAVAVGLVAVAFALLSERANHAFRQLVSYSPYLPFLVTPVLLGVVAWLTRRFFPGAEGSGIPQAISALQLHRDESRDRLVSLRIAVGKVLLTLLGLLSGASIGREGPTVHIGASIMHSAGRLARFPRHYLDRGLILAGSAAGIAAAFNTPLAGVVFAIEEMSRSFEERTSGTILTAVVFAGVTAVVVHGNYTYFGSTSVALPIGAGWIAAVACGVVGGILGGAFSLALLSSARWIAPLRGRHPVLLAAACGVAIAAIGFASGGTTYGTGYQEASQLVTGQGNPAETYPLLKLLATIVSYLSGIPGGIFAPSLATGAGLGADMAPLFPGVPATAIVILAMAGYFSGVVQTPITALVIVMEMTASQTMLLPIMVSSFVGYLISRGICRQSIYRALAQPFLAMEKTETAPARQSTDATTQGPNPDKLV